MTNAQQQASKTESAALSLYVGPISVTLLTSVPAVYNNTAINATVFANATLVSARGDVQLVLYSSTVTSYGGQSAKITLTAEERRSLIKQVYAAVSFTPLTLKIGNTSIGVRMYCLCGDSD